MLRGVEDVEVRTESGFVGKVTKSRTVVVRVGSSELVLPDRFTRDQLADMEQRSQILPVAYLSIGSSTYWRYGGQWYIEDTGLDAESVRTVLTERAVACELDRIPKQRDAATRERLERALPQQS